MSRMGGFNIFNWLLLLGAFEKTGSLGEAQGYFDNAAASSAGPESYFQGRSTEEDDSYEYIYSSEQPDSRAPTSRDFDELFIDPATNKIVDSKSRLRVFHGINLVRKSPPWYHPELLDPKYAENLKSWGLNVVRLGTMWSGLEPSEGEYDMDYVVKLNKIITNFEKNDVWVLLDLHQDVASSEFGTYDGFPRWLVDKLRADSEKRFPWPLAKIENWFCGYTTYEACDVYQNFYDNHHDAVDRFAKLWRFIASSFMHHKNIMGYDLINEPWNGNVYKDGSLMLPAVAGRRNFAPMYDQVVSAIKEVDTRNLVFYEPVVSAHWAPEFQSSLLNNFLVKFFTKKPLLSWLSVLSTACGSLKLNLGDSDAGFCHANSNSARSGTLADCIHVSNPRTGEPVFGSGFSQVPGGDIYKNKSVMSWHYYFPLFTYASDSYNPIVVQFARNIFAPAVFRRVNTDLKQIGGGQFLSEFGLCSPDTDRPDSFSSKECNFIMDKADQDTISWTYWDTSNLGVLWDNDGNPRINNVKGLSRPYPMAVAGRDVVFSFDRKKMLFRLNYMPGKGLSEVYIPPETFGSLPVILTSDNLNHTFDQANNRITLTQRSTDTLLGVGAWVEVTPEGTQNNRDRRDDQSWWSYLTSNFF